ncbi:MAG: hypothetical protein N3A63_08575 [Bacteroidetes bacterium]|nr:hypothetical protein [Bacteroidota bacterium]
MSTTQMSSSPSLFIDHTLHSRISLSWFISEHVTYTLGIRNKLIVGDSPEQIPHYAETLSQSDALLTLNTFLWKKRRSLNYLECDRCWFDYNIQNLRISIGKQRIAWGTSYVWNITDLFNPLSILDFDYEERPAVDALRLQYFTSDVSRIDCALTPSPRADHRTLALQYTMNIAEYDISLVIGYYLQRVLIGMNWVGTIRGIGFRGEMIVTEAPSAMCFATQNSFASQKHLQFSAVISVDYTFPTSLTLHSEVLYNNIGKTQSIRLFTNDARAIGLLSPSQVELFFRTSYTITPLFRVDAMILYNPFDTSTALLPQFNYSLHDDVDIAFIALSLTGKGLSEYSPTTRLYCIRTMLSF